MMPVYIHVKNISTAGFVQHMFNCIQFYIVHCLYNDLV